MDALDVIGPAEVFAYANLLSMASSEPYQVELVSAGADIYLQRNRHRIARAPDPGSGTGGGQAD